jgi:hypothetical protein
MSIIHPGLLSLPTDRGGTIPRCQASSEFQTCKMERTNYFAVRRANGPRDKKQSTTTAATVQVQVRVWMGLHMCYPCVTVVEFVPVSLYGCPHVGHW